MRLPTIALVLGLTVFAQTGCKSCHCNNAPPPSAYPIQVSPAPAAPIQVGPAPVTPAVGAMLPAYDPDRTPLEMPVPVANPTTPTSFNRLTSWSR